jgi:hypothetical protein
VLRPIDLTRVRGGGTLPGTLPEAECKNLFDAYSLQWHLKALGDPHNVHGAMMAKIKPKWEAGHCARY